jgi:TusA-related sulfurtransferase
MAKQHMASLRAGETLVVLASDPEAPIDLGAWAAAEGHQLSEQQMEGWCEFSLLKGGAA